MKKNSESISNEQENKFKGSLEDDIDEIEILEEKEAKEMSKQSFASTFKDNFKNSVLKNSTSKYLLDEGLKFYNNGEYKKAINCFQIVIGMEPNNQECRAQLLESTIKLDEENRIMDWDDNNILNQALISKSVSDFESAKSKFSNSAYSNLNKNDNEDDTFLNYTALNKSTIDNPNDIPQKRDYLSNDKKSVFMDNKINDKLFSKSSIISPNNKPQRAKEILAKNNPRKKFGKAFETLFTSMKSNNEGIAIFDIDGNLVFLNNTFADMHGYSPDKLIGKHLSTFHTEDQIPAVEAANNQILKSGEYTGELLHVRSDGKVFPILTHKSIMWDDSNKPIGIIGTYYDVTKLKITEDEIKKINSAIEQSVDGIAIADLELKLTYANDAFALMHGYSPIEMQGMAIGDIYYKEQVEMFKKRINHIQSQGLWTGELGCIRKDGTAFPLYLSVTLVKDEFENPKGLLLIARDIIERDRAEIVVQEVNKNLDSIINTIHEPLIVMDNELKILTANEAYYKLFNQTQAQIKGQFVYNMANGQWDIPKLHELLEEIIPQKKSVNNFEIECNLHSVGLRTMLFNAKVIHRGENRTQMVLLAMEDITERKQAEEELKWRLMKFKMEDGKVYLVKETNPSLSIEAFKDLLNVGYKGLIISRTPEKDFKKGVINGDCEFLWLAEKGFEKSLPPKLNEVGNRIESFTRKSVILIDRGDYLIFKNGFKKTLSFIHRLREFAYLGGNIVIVSFDPATLNKQEISLIEKECAEIEPRMTKKKLHDKQQKILRVIYEDNLIGKKPTYTTIGQEVGISKPTARKRIRILSSVGYVMESIKGRNKVLELTEMGKSLFLN